jgi:hypothetical protein
VASRISVCQSQVTPSRRNIFQSFCVMAEAWIAVEFICRAPTANSQRNWRVGDQLLGGTKRSFTMEIRQPAITNNYLPTGPGVKKGLLREGETIQVRASDDVFETTMMKYRLRELHNFYVQAGVQHGDTVEMIELEPRKWDLKKV